MHRNHPVPTRRECTLSAPSHGPLQPEAGGRGLRSVFLATGISAFGPLANFLLGGLAVLVREDLRFSEGRLGVSIAVFFTFASLSSAPAGRIADRVGGRATLRTGLIGSALALSIIAVSQAWWQLTAALAVAGFAHGVLQVGANLVLSDDVDPRHQGLGFGIKQSAIPLATLLAGASVPLIGIQFGWRTAYIGAAVLAVVALAFQSRPGARRQQRDGVGRTPRPPGQAPFERRHLVIMAAGVGFGAGSANVLAAFLVEYLAGAGMPLGRAGALLATVSGVGLVTRIVIGWAADVHGSAGMGSVAALLFSGAVGFGLLPVVDVNGFVVWIVATVAFAGGWGWPGLFTFIVARQNTHAPAAATGVTQAGIFAGAVAGPLLFGYSLSIVSYGVAWTAMAGAQLTAGLLVLAGRRAWRTTNAA